MKILVALAMIMTLPARGAWCADHWQRLLAGSAPPSEIPPITRTTVSLIAAVSENGIIGDGKKMPWHLPEDLNFFRERTTGHAVIMGRKTFDSLGRKPLANRKNIVITRQPDFLAPPGVLVAASLEQAIAMGYSDTATEIFIIGGGEIYRQALEKADRIYLTYVRRKVSGETPFPVLDPDHFLEIQRRSGVHDYSFHTFVRR